MESDHGINERIVVNRYLYADSVAGSVTRATYNRPLVYQGGEIFEQKRAFGLLRKIFNQFKIEATNGFRDLTKLEQERIINQRKKQAVNVLREGSFFEKDMVNYQEKTERITDNIYSPNMKWARKKAS